MPRPGPRRATQTYRDTAENLAEIRRTAKTQGNGTVTELLQRRNAFARENMPADWQPKRVDAIAS